ncbi:MAG TPA: hypothetical protein DCM54_00835, partial [Gammaproteobacteria bacterium]|nr:hypothetical protein [Gammaproteobacteria bacterium]
AVEPILDPGSLETAIMPEGASASHRKAGNDWSKEVPLCRLGRCSCTNPSEEAGHYFAPLVLGLAESLVCALVGRLGGVISGLRWAVSAAVRYVCGAK